MRRRRARRARPATATSSPTMTMSRCSITYPRFSFRHLPNGGYTTRFCLPNRLSLRFNHEEFCDGLYVRRKTSEGGIFGGSGALLDGRVAFGPAREAAFGSSGRPPAGFRRLGGRAQVPQKRRKGALYPCGRQAAGVVAPLPRQPPIGHVRPRQPQLGEGRQDQPRPPVGLLGMAHARGAPPERLLEEAEGVLHIEATSVSPPKEVEVRHGSSGAVPPQPQNPRLAPPLTSRQPLYLHQDERTDHDGQRPAAAPSLVRPDLRVHLGPSPRSHRPVAGA